MEPKLSSVVFVDLEFWVRKSLSFNCEVLNWRFCIFLNTFNSVYATCVLFVCLSEQYTSCINGIKSIQKNAKAPIEDLTVEGQRFSNPKFQIYKDNAGKFRFHLFARNGEIIADSSEGYETKEACLNGIDVVGQSGDAEIKDLTPSEEATTTNVEETPPTIPAETKTPQSIEMSKPEAVSYTHLR